MIEAQELANVRIAIEATCKEMLLTFCRTRRKS